MSSIQRQESFDSIDSYLSGDDFLEAPTLSSKELERARKEALYVLKTKSPEEAFKIFTEGSKYKVDNHLGEEKVETVKQQPTKAVAGNGKTTVPPPKN